MPKEYLTVLAIVLVLFEPGSLAALITTSALESFQENLPRYQERFVLLTDQLGRWLEAIGIDKSRAAVRDLINPVAATRLIYAVLANASETVGIWTALKVTLGYVIVNVVISNIVEPRLMGRELGMSSVVVLLSLIVLGLGARLDRPPPGGAADHGADGRPSGQLPHAGQVVIEFGDSLAAGHVYKSARRNDPSNSGPLNGFCRTAATFADNRGNTA